MQSVAHLSTYHVVDQHSVHTLFSAFSIGGETRLANFVLPKIGSYKRVNAVWRQISKELRRPPQTLVEVEPLFACLARRMGRELAGMQVADTPRNRIKLLNLHMAKLSNRLSSPMRGESAWSHEILAWLDADVDIEHLLYAFDRNGGWNWYEDKTAVPLEEARELQGVPLRNVRALYSQAS